MIRKFEGKNIPSKNIIFIPQSYDDLNVLKKNSILTDLSEPYSIGNKIYNTYVQVLDVKERQPIYLWECFAQSGDGDMNNLKYRKRVQQETMRRSQWDTLLPEAFDTAYHVSNRDVESIASQYVNLDNLVLTLSNGDYVEWSDSLAKVLTLTEIRKMASQTWKANPDKSLVVVIGANKKSETISIEFPTPETPDSLITDIVTQDPIPYEQLQSVIDKLENSIDPDDSNWLARCQLCRALLLQRTHADYHGEILSLLQEGANISLNAKESKKMLAYIDRHRSSAYNNILKKESRERWHLESILYGLKEENKDFFDIPINWLYRDSQNRSIVNLTSSKTYTYNGPDYRDFSIVLSSYNRETGEVKLTFTWPGAARSYTFELTARRGQVREIEVDDGNVRIEVSNQSDTDNPYATVQIRKLDDPGSNIDYGNREEGNDDSIKGGKKKSSSKDDISASKNSRLNSTSESKKLYHDRDGDALGDPNDSQSRESHVEGWVDNTRDKCPKRHGLGSQDGCPKVKIAEVEHDVTMNQITTIRIEKDFDLIVGDEVSWTTNSDDSNIMSSSGKVGNIQFAKPGLYKVFVEVENPVTGYRSFSEREIFVKVDKKWLEELLTQCNEKGLYGNASRPLSIDQQAKHAKAEIMSLPWSPNPEIYDNGLEMIPNINAYILSELMSPQFPGSMITDIEVTEIFYDENQGRITGISLNLERS